MPHSLWSKQLGAECLVQGHFGSNMETSTAIPRAVEWLKIKLNYRIMGFYFCSIFVRIFLPGWSNQEIYQKVCKEKFQEPLPDDCPEPLEHLINTCRAYDSFQRPSAGGKLQSLYALLPLPRHVHLDTVSTGLLTKWWMNRFQCRIWKSLWGQLVFEGMKNVPAAEW